LTAAGGTPTHEPIAIVGIGCRFPGGIVDAASYWRALANGVDAITEIPADRIDLARWFDARPATPGRMMTRWGGFLDRIEEFDALAFGISPREAERMDPQQRLLLETSWEALEDAGQDVSRLDGSRTGVFVGQWLSDFESRIFADASGVDFYMTTGSGRYATSGRLSYTLGLRGPSLTLDTACSSSLVAVHLAVQSIRSGECDLALAGGVNVILQPQVSIAYSQSLMMAPDGRCKFGDVAGDGYVRSEGAGVVVLKPLTRARADADEIYAVVRGSAVNNDGRSSGSLGTPSQAGQEELLRTAYRDAGVSPGTVGYIEAHGTGTRVGDPVELGALGAVLGEDRAAGARCAVGSVKSNIGHTEGAAGIAGLIKAALALKHGAIPPSLHLKERNPAVPWATLPLEIPTALRDWPDAATARRAGVSAFGIAGTNAHIVLEQAPAPVRAAYAKPARQQSLLALSAKSAEALRALAARYGERVEAASAASLRDICWSAATRRTALPHRAAFVGADGASMAAALRRYADDEQAAAEGVVQSAARAKIALICPGQGAQWVGMGRELMARKAVFRAALERCDGAAAAHVDWSIIAQLQAEPGSAAWRLDDIGVIQPVLVALSIAYAELWRSLGVIPDAVVGHSKGEVAAAHIAGVLDLEQAMRIICRRSAIMRRASGRGAMLLVELSMDDARARIAGREALLSVAVSNSPRSSVISGDPGAVQGVMAELEREHVFCRLIKVDVASHSPQMQPLADELGAELMDLAPRSAQIAIYSTVTGRRADGAEFDASYWAGNLRQPVQFARATQALLEEGITLFIELGPHPILLPSVEQTAQSLDRPARMIACGRSEQHEQAAMLEAVGGVWAAGGAVDWTRVMAEGGEFVRLPLYPWQRERHWVEAAEAGASASRGENTRQRPDAESVGLLYALRWKALDRQPAESRASELRSNWIVVATDDTSAAAVSFAFGEIGARATVCAPDALPSILAQQMDSSPDVTFQGIVLLSDDGADAPYAPLQILQAILRSSSRPRLWFVTRGSQSIDDNHPSRVSVDQGALWGAGRTIAEEHPELWGGLVDLDPVAAPERDAALLVAHILEGTQEDQVAFRGGRRFVLRLVPSMRDGRQSPYSWRTDGAYLVTGGLGEIGLRVAQTMVQRGVRRLVLIGRTPLPPRTQWGSAIAGSETEKRIAAVRALEALGAAVHVACVDVGNENDLRRFLDEYAAEAWPPIRGVIHAAGFMDNHIAVAMSRASFDAVLQAKLRGAQLLDRLLPGVELFVMFSSMSTIFAQPGLLNYAAANAGLDALALDRRARGLPALSIAWGVWENTGVLRGAAGAHNVAELARQGIEAFSPEQGVMLFAWLCGRTEPTAAVLAVDWSAFHRARVHRPTPLFRDVSVGITGSETALSGLSTRLASTEPDERRRLIEPLVRETIGRVLKIAPSRLDARRALGTMGLNSLLAMELRNRLESALGRSLSATLAWNYPTVEALVAHLSSAESPTIPSRVVPVAQAVGAHLSSRLSEVVNLTDDDATRELRRAPRPAGP
jgi:phthiocerol/phenolphthiocerol synthesis type-I polyketide synthase B